MQASLLKFSIITVTFNSERFVEETILSVLSQTYPYIEYIIIDGASTDSTPGIISRYRDRLHYFISEPDENMYDAINKGLAQATGDFILVLNSDDVLHDAACIQKIATHVCCHQSDVLVADIVTTYNSKLAKKRRHSKVSFSELLLSGHSTFLPHPALFVSQKTNSLLNGYNTHYRYAADFDYILRMLQLPGIRICNIPVYVTIFRIHPTSITSSGKINNERLSILEKYGYKDHSLLSRKMGWFYGWMKYVAMNFDNYIQYFTSRVRHSE